jgi:hypothetical protein
MQGSHFPVDARVTFDRGSPIQIAAFLMIRDKGITDRYKSLSKEGNSFTRSTKQVIQPFSWFPNVTMPAYCKWAEQFLLDPRDVIFVSHIFYSFLTVVPSALYLLYSFNWIHAILHTVLLGVSIPPYILMLHCICHKRCGNSKGWWVDFSVHYILGLFHGETVNTFYYHHVKHHHIEDNGPSDLSATIWYDRDNAFHFLIYYLRFFFLCGFELPWYFIKKRNYRAAILSFAGEYLSIAFYLSFFWICSDPKSVIFAWLVPFNMARIGMMTGNWTQHAFLDQNEAANDYKSAITCIDTLYNATAFNDGYHTSHHLNPIRHWQDHPEYFLASVDTFNKQRVIIFTGCDYFEIWFRLMIKDFDWMAKRLLTLGEATLLEKKEFLKARVKRLNALEMKQSFAPKSK